MESQHEQENMEMNDGSVVQGGLEATCIWLGERKLKTLAQPLGRVVTFPLSIFQRGIE